MPPLVPPQTAGTFAWGVAAAWLVARPLLRHTLASHSMHRSWVLDVPLTLGLAAGLLGSGIVHSLGGSWAVWLLAHWLWCAMVGAMYAQPLPQGLAWRFVAAGAVAVAAPVAVGVMPFTLLGARAEPWLEAWVGAVRAPVDAVLQGLWQMPTP